MSTSGRTARHPRPYVAGQNVADCGARRVDVLQSADSASDGTPDLGTPVALGTTLPGPSGETAATPTAYTVVSRATGKCLDVNGASTADRADVQQWKLMPA